MARWGVIQFEGAQHYYEPVADTYRVTRVGVGAVAVTEALRNAIHADEQRLQAKTSKGWNNERPTFLEATGERLARLNPGAAWPGDQVQTGATETPTAELAMALGYCNPLGVEILTAKYVQVKCRQAQRRLFQQFYTTVIGMVNTDKWEHGPVGKHWYRNMTTLAVLELTDSALCPHCNGTGRHVKGQTCVLCRGTGRHAMSDEARAESLEIPMPLWKEKWRARYEKIYRRLAAMEHIALEEVGRQLRRVV
jgi:hypothetical protein